jgi:xanthine/uracil permease
MAAAVSRTEVRHLLLSPLLWAGVALVTTGVGILVKQNLERIGPLTIALALGLAAALCLAWVVWRAPRFSWGEVPSPNLAFDYILVLGLALVAADLAYVEVQFSPLGANWTWHLLIVSLLYAVAAFRFDSRVVWSLALSTLLAWRGVSISDFGHQRPFEEAPALSGNAIACGVVFCLLGWILRRVEKKPHFEPVATHLGWLSILGGLVIGMLKWDELHFAAALLVAGAGLAFGAFRTRRFSLFAFGVVGAYIAATRIFFEIRVGEVLGCFWFCASGLAFVLLLVFVQRKLKEPA